MKRNRWVLPLLAGVLLVVAVGWGAASRSDDDGGGVDPAVREQAPNRSGPVSPSPGEPGEPSKPAEAAEAKAPARSPQDVLYLGDSLAMEAQDVLGGWLQRSDLVASYASEPVAGVTVCDYLQGRPGESLVPAEHKAAELVRERRPGVIVLQFWGNTWGYTPCMEGVQWGTPEYYARYAADVRALTRQVAKAARQADVPRPKLVWVLQPPEPLHPERIERVNEIYERQADAAGDLLADGGRELRDGDGEWTQYLPCNEYERSHPDHCTGPGGTAQLHLDADPLHFCLAPTPEGGRPCPATSPGLVRYSRAVADAVGAYLRG